MITRQNSLGVPASTDIMQHKTIGLIIMGDLQKQMIVSNNQHLQEMQVSRRALLHLVLVLFPLLVGQKPASEKADGISQLRQIQI